VAPSFDDALRERLNLPLPGLEAQLRMAPRPRLTWNPQGQLNGARHATIAGNTAYIAADTGVSPTRDRTRVSSVTALVSCPLRRYARAS